MLCQQCGSTIEEGWKDRPPLLAKFCLKCRSDRRRRHSLKYTWLPQYDAYLRGHYHGGLHQRGRVTSTLMRQTGVPRWYIKRQARRHRLCVRALYWNKPDLVLPLFGISSGPNQE